MQLRMHTAGMAFMLGGAHEVVDFEPEPSPVDRTSGAQVFVDVVAIITGDCRTSLTVQVPSAPHEWIPPLARMRPS